MHLPTVERGCQAREPTTRCGSRKLGEVALQELERICKTYAVDLPDALKALYMLHNGQHEGARDARECANHMDPSAMSFHPGLFGQDPQFEAQVGLLPLKTAIENGRATACPFAQMARHEVRAEGGGERGGQGGRDPGALVQPSESRAIVIRPPSGKLMLAACTGISPYARNAKYILYNAAGDEVRHNGTLNAITRVAVACTSGGDGLLGEGASRACVPHGLLRPACLDCT